MEKTNVVDLSESRKTIDQIDKQIVQLFEHRMKVAKDVAEYKRATGKAVYDKEREVQKLDTLKNFATDDFNRHAVEELFVQIMSMSRKAQYAMLANDYTEKTFSRIDGLPQGKDTKVAFFGVQGSYTEQAMEECFGTEITSYPEDTFKAVVDAVMNGEVDYGVLPIENTTTGGITDSYDLLVQADVCIVAEHVIKVEQSLLGVEGAKLADIKTVYSHAQGIRQCKTFFEQNLAIKTVEEGSTAGCAKKVLVNGDKTIGAIASVRAANTYGLSVLAENISDEDVNSTRFIIISKKKQYIKGANKMSICFSLPHETGSLYNMLSHIIYNSLNMTKIESRPLSGKKFEYRFFVDFEGKIEDAGVKNALKGIEAESLELKILGNYRCV
ncbi:MAG: prephenate dehydratase [Lachnospiraceae bacterium]|nr:prephenate dehydratase [Lachnospiraceae bacterium]